MATQAMFRIWRGDPAGGEFQDYVTPVEEGMVVLDAVHRIQAQQAPDLAVRWNCKAGKCGSCSAEINGMPKLMCMTRLSNLNLEMPVIIEPMHAFPVDPRSGHRRLLELPGQEDDQEIQASFTRCAGRHMAHAAGRRRTRAGVSQVHRVFSLPGCVPCSARAPQAGRVHRSSLLVYVAALEMHPLDTEDRVSDLKQKHNIGYCNITTCCRQVCPESITITENAIIPLKERVVDRFFDPLKQLFHIL